MVTTIGDLEFYMGPHQLSPHLDNLEDCIVGFIDGANKKLEIAVQELESRPIAEAILRAEIERKVQVKLVLEADYLASKKRPKSVARAFESTGSNETNRALALALLRGTVWLRSDFNPKIFHQKFMVRDGASVLTGSTNFTPTGVGASPLGGNLNHVLIAHSRGLAKAYSREFKEISAGHFGRYSVDGNVAPEPVKVSDVWLKPCFAPDHNPEMEIMKQMAKAKSRIDFAIFTFSKSSGIDDAMKLARRAGVKVSGVLDHAQGNQVWAATHGLAEEGVEISMVRKQHGHINKLHHKLMTIDDRVLIIGSFNYTGPANVLNDENIIVIGNPDTDEAKPMALAARMEIDRICREHGEAFGPS
ncbi:MAG: phospholipase D-like domain-containing protein [Pseudomonadota bacterium]